MVSAQKLYRRSSGTLLQYRSHGKPANVTLLMRGGAGVALLAFVLLVQCPFLRVEIETWAQVRELLRGSISDFVITCYDSEVHTFRSDLDES